MRLDDWLAGSPAGTTTARTAAPASEWNHVECVVVAALVFGTAFFNLVSLDPTKTTVGLDPQVMVKLAMTALCGAYGAYWWLSDGRLRKWLVTFPMFWMTVIAVVNLAACATSVAPIPSLASAGSLWCMILFLPAACVRIGSDRVLAVMAAALGAFVTVSWVVYLVHPALGVYMEPLSDGRFAKRMAGISHPNTLGQYSGLLIVVMFVRWREGRRWRIGHWGLLGLAASALVLSISRGSMVGVVGALGLVYGLPAWRRIALPKKLAAAGMALALVCGSMLAGSSLDWVRNSTLRLTKSGSFEELRTATGRSEIWAYSAQLIAQRPVLGYGPATSKYLLHEFSDYTHNLWLNAAFSAGLLCAFAAAALAIWSIIGAWSRPHPMSDVILLFIFINGVVENVILEYIPSGPTMFLLGALMLRFPLVRPGANNVTGTA